MRLTLKLLTFILFFLLLFQTVLADELTYSVFKKDFASITGEGTKTQCPSDLQCTSESNGKQCDPCCGKQACLSNRICKKTFNKNYPVCLGIEADPCTNDQDCSENYYCEIQNGQGQCKSGITPIKNSLPAPLISGRATASFSETFLSQILTKLSSFFSNLRKK